MNEPKKRVGILISGRGSNMAALIEAAKDEAFPAKIAGVISNRADAGGLETARTEGIEARAILRRNYSDNAAHDAAIDAALTEMGVEIVCLAGYMRMLTPGFVQLWAGRMINIHPSLLPLHKGLDTHRRAIEAGDAEHGCTVHFVTTRMDDGPVIAQARLPILPGETPERLAARVLIEEHRLYPRALRLVAEGKAPTADGRTMVASPER